MVILLRKTVLLKVIIMLSGIGIALVIKFGDVLFLRGLLLHGEKQARQPPQETGLG